MFPQNLSAFFSTTIHELKAFSQDKLRISINIFYTLKYPYEMQSYNVTYRPPQMLQTHRCRICNNMQVQLATKHNILAVCVNTILFVNLIFVILCDLSVVESCCTENVGITIPLTATTVIYVHTNQ